MAGTEEFGATMRRPVTVVVSGASGMRSGPSARDEGDRNAGPSCADIIIAKGRRAGKTPARTVHATSHAVHRRMGTRTPPVLAIAKRGPDVHVTHHGA